MRSMRSGTRWRRERRGGREGGVLACLLVHEQHWLSSLDQLIAMRRGVKLRHGISTRPEIKSTDIRRGQGPLQDLRWSPSQRRQFFDELVLSASGRLRNAHVFSVAIDKQPCAAKGRDPRSTAWEFAIQRLDRFSRAMQEHVSVFPDEGHAVLIKGLMRRMRRYHAVPKRWGLGTFAIPTERVIEDPNDRRGATRSRRVALNANGPKRECSGPPRERS